MNSFFSKTNAILGFLKDDESSARNILAKLKKKCIFRCSFEKVKYPPDTYIAYIRTFTHKTVVASHEYKIIDVKSW